MNEPCSRSSHTRKTPNLGGVGIFISFLICTCISASVFNFLEIELKQLLSVIGSISILFFLGIKDDLIGITPLQKLIGQFFAALIVVFIADIRIDSFFNLFGIENLNYLTSVSLSLFSFLFFANAYNLIDGIDGLAGSVGAMMSLVFGLFFVVFGDFQAAIISFVLLSSLLGFLKHNLSKTRKIFMGDSGSLFVGFLLMLQAIYFLKLDFSEQALFLPNKLVFVYALFAFPILDTVRVFVLRIANGRSPFSADRNHLHHKLLDLGLSHKKSSAVIVISNITLVVITLMLFKLNVNIQLLIALPLSIVLFYFPFLIKNKSRVTQTKSIS